MTEAPAPPRRLLDGALHASGGAHAVWTWMRAHAPVHHQPPTEYPAFWSLTRYEDIRAVYRDTGTFSSERGVLLRPCRLGEDPGGGLTLALTDPPRHRRIRALMAGFFGVRAVRGLGGALQTTARRLVAEAVERGSCDVAQDIAGRLSLSAICRIMGFPEADHERLYRWTNEVFHAHTSLVAHPGLLEYFSERLARSLKEPGDDLVSALVHGTVDGAPLTEQELILNWENLIGATENGRLALIGGMLAFLEHPGEWERLRRDRGLMPGALEEVLRWTSSATHSMRTATRPHTIRGRRIEAGERVVLWLPSANRDESVFRDPFRFDISRSPNRHLALAAGPHHCIGGPLARAGMSALFGELLDTVRAIEPGGPVVRLRSVAVGGPESLPVRMTAR
ncbi:cytochrome P450 [Streptomyces hoynatensis]|uniref:Cytochrome P450 n=1 Tax=Streptomyces hoynatensis TaxID=1141874 RepID=A0A3A9ZC01_9ACTN|nr:cytochrome P450 [Streptomyces hoynatensis]RKN44896.1 cytochrome P450 [Streptomyces hoynatensis]